MLRALILTALLLPAAAFARDWQVDAAKSSLTFKGTYQNGPFDGAFGKFDAAISFDENDLSKDRFDVKVDVGSADTKSTERNDTLRTPDFFDTAKYPQAHFITQAFGKGDDGSLEAKGSLTIRDKSKPVTLKVAVYEGDEPVTNVETVTFDSVSEKMEERKRWVPLVLRDRPYDKKAAYRLILRDAETGVEQQGVPVVIDRAIHDDF